MPGLVFEFSGELFHWRGPSPYHYVAVPEDESEQIGDVAKAVTYGWGVIPVAVQAGRTRWTTSLFPKDGRYLVPLKDAVCKTERISLGDTVSLRLTIDL